MNFEVLKRSHAKRNILIGVIIVLILSAVILTFTRAKYKITQSIPLVSGTINFSPYDFNVVAMYLNKNGESIVTKKAPHVGYTLNEEQSTCEVDNERVQGYEIVYNAGLLNFNNLSQSGTKCSVYFDLIPDSENPIIKNLYKNSDEESITVTVNATDNEGIFYYYFKIDDGEYIQTEDDTYTFDNLIKDQIYKISVRVEDAAGNSAEFVENVQVGYKVRDIILAGKEEMQRGTINSGFDDTTTGKYFTTKDWTGNTTYYFAGNPTDNWVYFAGYYWRIIRINGDGTVRMIYQGTEANTTGTGTQIETSVFNTENNASYYVGLVYNLNEQHGYGINSTIMDNLNSWFNDNLNNDSNPSKQFYEYISNEAGFCSDRNMSSGYNWSSNPTSDIYYAANDRITGNLATPSLQCDEQDILSKSNGKLENPIGLITIDEAVLAGLYFTAKNTVNNFLNTERFYWTMTPYLYAVTRYESKAYVYLIYPAGYVGDFSSGFVTNVNGVRPVINLRADVQIVSGDGTASNPYVIAT